MEVWISLILIVINGITEKIGIIIRNGLLVENTSLDTYVSKLKVPGIYFIQVPEDTDMV